MNKLALKCVANAVITVPLFVFLGNATWLGSVIASLGLSILAYVIGDQWVLRATNNLFATLADAGLVFVYVWAVSALVGWTLTFGEIALITALLAVVELLFHRYLGIRDERAS